MEGFKLAVKDKLKMEKQEYNKRTDELIKMFSEEINPSKGSARLAEKIFSFIGELRGENIGLKLNQSDKD